MKKSATEESQEELVKLIKDKAKGEGGHIKLIKKLKYGRYDVEFTDIRSDGSCKFTVDGRVRQTPLETKTLGVLQLIWEEIKNNKFL